jgi:hypothetical protein
MVAKMRARLIALALICAAPAQAEPLHDAIDAYAMFQRDISALADLDVRDADSMDAALALALGHDPERLAQGYLAYGALTAAQSPAFVAGVRSRVRAAGRAPVLRQLNRDSFYARRRPPGSAEAIGLILAASAADSARMRAASRRYTSFADSLAYAPSDSARRDTRSARLRALRSRRLDRDDAARVHPAVLAATPLSEADAFGGVHFWDGLAQRRAPTPPPVRWRESAAQTARVNRMLTLAGLFIVDSGETARVREQLNHTALRECLHTEQLELRQCASVAASANEDGHCLARHGLAEPAACFAPDAVTA